jgi:predicted enzyme related to lactoylglutathione lyase
MGNPVVHFEILSPDAAKLQKFYAELFGWTINADNSMQYGIADTGATGKGINGGIGVPMDGKNRVTFYVGVDSIDDTFAKLAAAGGKAMGPKMTVPPSGPVLGYFTDPAGNTIGLVDMSSSYNPGG